MARLNARSIGWHAGTAVTIGLLWEAAARAADSLLVPPASATLAALWRLLAHTEFWTALWVSNQALLVGLPAAAAAGIVVGLALGRWPALARWCDPHVHILLVAPKIAFIPLVIMALGLGLLSRATVVAAFAFPIIAVTVQSGVRSVDPRLVDMARAFCAREAQIWRRVLLPGARPAIATALRLGLARAIAGMVSVELTLVAVGLGQLVLRFRADFDAASLYAAVLVVVAEAVLLVRLATLLEHRLGSSSPMAVAE